MELKVKRLYKKSDYTIGKMYINGEYFCDTVEDTERGLTSDMTYEEIARRKVYGRTAIPTGRYDVAISYSPKFKKNLPLLLSVKGYSGIRIHNGKDANSSLGCIIVGENKIKGGVINSKATMEKLMQRLQNGREKHITIEIC